jgi:hypothetical protein
MAQGWWEDREHRDARNRTASGVALAAVAVVLVLQVTGIGDLNDNVNGFTLGLLLLAIVLGFAVVSPAAVKEVLDRITTFKFGGVELGLQAAERLDLLQTPLADDEDELTPRDDVTPSEDRPRGGGAVREYTAVQEKLEGQLERVRDDILCLDAELSPLQVVEQINRKRLLKHLEVRVLYDLLGQAEIGVERLPDADLSRYLDRAWRFTTRFETLVFERDVRKRLIKRGWYLFDFEQSRKHRPDFLAYKQTRSKSKGEGPSTGDWLLLATRVTPTIATKTIRRLQKQRPPYGARRVVVVPNRRKESIADVEGATPVEDRPAVVLQAPAGKTWMVDLDALLRHPEPPAF